MYRDCPVMCKQKNYFSRAGGGRLQNPLGRQSLQLHLIRAQVFVVKIFEPAPQFLVRGFFRRGARNF